eukprot:7364113-Lingulodinium_polyedra.AAC.1
MSLFAGRRLLPQLQMAARPPRDARRCHSKLRPLATVAPRQTEMGAVRRMASAKLNASCSTGYAG